MSAQENPPKYNDYAAPPEERARELVSRMTLEEKVSQMQNEAPAISRLGIPAYDWWNEALHGVARAGLATVFPQAIGLAATWDTDLVFRIACVISTEARAKYNDAIAHGNRTRYHGLTFWSPNINIFRDPRWGRGQETYGEDPYLTAQIAVQFVKGMQGDDPHYLKTIATSKHFAVHSGPELLRHRFNAQVTGQELDDTYLYAFRHTVEQAHVRSVMCAYNSVNGAPACASDLLLNQHLRNAWKFQGYVVSDCDAVEDIYTGHHYAKSLAEASALAVKTGTDLDCGTTYRNLIDAVKQGLISEAEINRSVERLFTARFRLGMFDPPDRVPFSTVTMDQVASEPHDQLAIEAAEKSIVLLKNNDHLLPLENAPKNIAVIGPAADDPDALLGNYNGIPRYIATPLDGIQREFAHSTVRFALGSTYVVGWTALVPQNVLSPQQNRDERGLLAEYFSNENLTGTPQLSRVEHRSYFNLDMQDPAVLRAIPREHFAIRWSGYLRVDQSGEYRLGFVRPECEHCRRSDSARLYVDGDLVLADSGTPSEPASGKTAPVELKAGKRYKLRIDYVQTGGSGAALELVWTPPANAALTSAVELAKNSDISILCVGLNSRLEGEESKLVIPGFNGGDRTDIRLPDPQRNLMNAVFDTGKPVIVVLVNGSALAIADAKQHAHAILEAWYGGQGAGTAIASTLSGKNNPAGRLPVTFYESVDQLPPFTDYSMNNRTYRFFTGHPLYPFGYGLTYSDFRYSNLKVDRSNAGIALASATVTNTSSRDGDETVQLYLSRPDGSSPQLRGFRRLHLKAGESQTVRFEFNGTEIRGRMVSIGGGQPRREWTGNHFITETTSSSPGPAF